MMKASSLDRRDLKEELNFNDKQIDNYYKNRSLDLKEMEIEGMIANTKDKNYASLLSLQLKEIKEQRQDREGKFKSNLDLAKAETNWTGEKGEKNYEKYYNDSTKPERFTKKFLDSEVGKSIIDESMIPFLGHNKLKKAAPRQAFKSAYYAASQEGIIGPKRDAMATEAAIRVAMGEN